MTTDYDAPVAIGAALLDQRFPGWETDVELGDLDQGSTQYCVAAQIVCDSQDTASYDNAMRELDLVVYSQAVAHGFALSGVQAEERCLEVGFDANVTVLYALLTDAWRRLITARLAPLEATP